MAEKKKGKKRKEDFPSDDSKSDKPSKQEFTLAKWMRDNVPIKKTKFLNHNVEYFTAKRACDAIMESKWVTDVNPVFKTREDVVDYLHLMLEHKFYHRARKVPISEADLKGKKKDKKQETTDKEKLTEKETKGTDAESSVVEGKEKEQPAKEKLKKKIRLDMHLDQKFVDGMDAYVWIYDPIPFYYWIFGTLLVLGAIGVCLFPLWPPSVRLGVYYLSVAAAGLLVTIIVLAVLRVILFCLIWMCTLGKHHLWILPNLTEDVGFFASFWPLYTYEYRGNDYVPPKKDKGKKKKKDKDSDAEEEVDKSNNPEQNLIEPKNEESIGNVDVNSQVEGIGASETESESSQRSSTGKDFEIVDQTELDS